jgi:SRSO17 transposase
MERRFAVRLDQLMSEAQVTLAVFSGVLSRLTRFVEPFAARLGRIEQRKNAEQYIAGLLSGLKRKNVESIAYHHDQERQGLQKFIGQSPWDHAPLLLELASQVGAALGEADGVIVFDPSGFVKKGTASVGVQRQWCGRLGKVENCQVGVFLGYVSRKEHVLANVRLYLPEEWARDRARRNKGGVPKTVQFQTRHELALSMLADCGSLLPHRWIAGDDEMGRSSKFRADLRALKEQYLLGIPSNTRIRDPNVEPPAYCGHGRHPQPPLTRVDRWREALPEESWTTVNVRDGEKSPLTVQIVAARMLVKPDRSKVTTEETLVIIRRTDDEGAVIHDYYFSNADPTTPLAEFARVAKAEHRIEDCLKRGKSETGLADYEVRTWEGWHHHQTLSLIAAWFLTKETQRGKNPHTGNHRSTNSPWRRSAAAPKAPMRSPDYNHQKRHPPTATQRTSALLSLENAQPTAAATS